MAVDVIMPSLGFDMTEGLLARWLMNEGDPVAKGQAIAEIETEKATVEIEGPPLGPFTGKWKDAKGEASDLISVQAGGDRLWVVAPTPFGPIEFRIVIDAGKLSGEWAAPFGRNGPLSGHKLR